MEKSVMRSLVRLSEMDEPERHMSPAIGETPAPALLADRRAPQERAAAGARGDAEGKEARIANLAGAMRRARLANAERSGVLADLREAEIARLDILRDHLSPVLAQVPKDCDLFDVGVSQGERPRLFIDHVGFVEMARDRRVYRFLQDTRFGRVTIGESDDVSTLVEAITEYIAHRLIEREKTLASDFAGQGGSRAFAAEARRRIAAPAKPRRGIGEWLYRACLFLAQGAGAAAFFFLLWRLGLYALELYSAR